MTTTGDLYGSRIPSDREQRCIVLVAAGMTNRDISTELGTTEHVVKNLLRSIYDKLGLWNRVELALWYEHRKREAKRAHPAARAATVSLN
jgi:DNA-binding CsgD family transcriptional regulator